MITGRVHREDGSVEIVTESGRWDVINAVRAMDKGVKTVYLGGGNVAAEVIPGRGDLELRYLSDGATYWMEVLE